MKPEDFIAEMRDIQLPALEQQSFIAEIVWWPLIVFTVALLFLIFSIWRRQNWWRTEIHTTLDRIQHSVDAGELVPAWQQLGNLLKRIAIKVKADPDLAGSSGENWLAELDAIFDTGEFKSGRGRGLIHYPYVRQSDAGADDIRELIALVRSHVPDLQSPR